MTKISLELLQNPYTDSDAFSPVIWDGSRLIVTNNPDLNLKKLKDDINALVSDLEKVSIQHQQRADRVDSISKRTRSLDDKKSYLNDTLSTLTSKVYPDITTLGNLNVKISLVESQVYEQISSLEQIEKVVDRIRSGVMLRGIGKDTEVYFQNGTYVLDRKYDAETKIVSSNDNIQVTYLPDSNTYYLNGTAPDIRNLFEVSKGLNLKIEEGKYVTVGLLDSFISANGGLTAIDNQGYYSLDFSDNFIVASPDGGLVVTRNDYGNFEIDFSDQVKQALGKKYYPGYGIIFTGKTISADTSILPTFVAGSGIKIEKIAINPDTYRISIDEKTASLPKNSVIVGSDPITVYSNYFDNIKATVYYVTLDSNFTNSLITQLSSLENKALDLYNSSKYVLVDNFTDYWKKSYMCPILKLIDLVSGNVEGSGLMSPNADPIDIKLYNIFGTYHITLNLYEDMLPYLVYSEIGSGTVMGIENEVDLFIPLQNKLRELLGDPTFFIPEKDKGTKYRITMVDTNLDYSAKSRDQLPTMFYNMEFTISAFSEWNKNRGWSDWNTPCPDVPISTFNSTTYPGMPLLVTGGDLDFIAGKARAGQTNATRLTMPPDLSESVKIHLLSVIKEEDATSRTYTMQIKDDYTGNTYSAKFKRLIGPSINKDLDYITELEGQSNPGHVRAFSRLYTNWKMNDEDLNRLVYFLGANNCCLARYSGDLLYRGIYERKIWSPTYLREVSYTAGIKVGAVMDPSKVDYSTGKAKIKIDLLSGTVGYSQFPIDLMMNYIKFEIDYEFYLGNIYDEALLFADCCWGDDFDPKDKLNCGVDDKVGYIPSPNFPDPEDNFGRVSDVLRAVN